MATQLDQKSASDPGASKTPTTFTTTAAYVPVPAPPDVHQGDHNHHQHPPPLATSPITGYQQSFTYSPPQPSTNYYPQIRQQVLLGPPTSNGWQNTGIPSGAPLTQPPGTYYQNAHLLAVSSGPQVPLVVMTQPYPVQENMQHTVTGAGQQTGDGSDQQAVGGCRMCAGSCLIGMGKSCICASKIAGALAGLCGCVMCCLRCLPD